MTDTTGSSILGYSRTESRLNETAPINTISSDRTVAKTGRLLIIEETPAAFGLGAEIAAQIADVGFDDLDAPVKRVNGAFAPTPYAPTLEAAVVPTEMDVARAIRELVRE